MPKPSVLLLRTLVLVQALALAECSGSPRPEMPAPSTEPPPEPAAPQSPPAPAAPVIPASNQICGVQVGRTQSLADLGLPEGSRPVDLALGKDTVWLLFEPALLVGLPREATELAPVAIPEFGAIEEMADLIAGPAGAKWSALTVDWDGTVWIVSAEGAGLWRKPPGRRPQAVRLPAAPAPRRGGFRDVLAGRGSVWLAPACADSAAWRLAPSGKLLGTAFDGAPNGAPEGCPVAAFERDWSGTFWALRPDRGELFQLGFDQTWQPAGSTPGPPAPAPAGSEPVESWFFWGAEPVGLSADGTLLYRNVGGQVAAFREDCGEGNALVGVAGDEKGWVVLTRQWLRMAGHQREGAAGGE